MQEAPRVVTIGIAGGTASGKTSIARRVAETLGEKRALLLSHDRYYRDVENPRTFNYDHPDALDTELLVQNLRELRAGQSTQLPVYHFPTHTRHAEREVAEPRPVVVVEGILVLEDEELRSLLDLKVFVHAPDDLRLIRRIRRDVAERGRDLDEVLNRWLLTVRPMHMRYVDPSRTYADAELNGVGLVEPLVESVLSLISRHRGGWAETTFP